MDVKLYYIEGISRTDTPYYAEPGTQATLARQAEYFASKLVRTVSTSFYPPHYTNEIKFDTDDIDFDDTINYLSLSFRGKEYYYFIDDIEYMNEGVIKLYVTMDTIQTYMFNIRIASGVIERKFINRWNEDDTINRGYLRENLSTGLLADYSRYEQINNTNYYVIAKGEDKLFPNISRGSIQTVNNYNTKLNLSCMRLYCCPLVENATITMVDQASSPTHNLNAEGFVRSVAKDAYIKDVYLIPFNPFNDITDTGGSNIRAYGTSIWYYGQSSEVAFTEWCFTFRLADNEKCVSKLNSRSITLNYSKNTIKDRFFSSVYVPAMMDENYVMLEFGSKHNNTTYPLYYANNNSFTGYYFADLFTGARYYFIANSSDGFADKHKTMSVDGSAIGLEMINEAWNSYVANNRARWLGPIVQAGKNAVEMLLTKGASGAAKVGVIGTEMSKSKVNVFEQIRNKKGQFTGKKRLTGSNTAGFAKKLYGEIPGSDDGMYDTLRQALSTSIPITTQLESDANKMFAPDTITQTGDYGDVYSQASVIYYGVKKVVDYEQCAQYYHRNGYLVNEYVNNINDIFNYVVNRYYYNVLKMSVPEIHLVGVIEDQSTIDSIKSRLEDGVRLWSHISNIHHDEYTETQTRMGTYTTYCPWQISTIHYATASIVPGTGSGTVLVTLDSYDAATGRITYTLNGGAGSGSVFEIVFHGSFTEQVDDIPIGDFEYDNVELDYLS